MEEIEVGEYVRYNGEIHKIEQIGNTMFWVENGLAIEIEQNSFNQYKHSKNIIDLIEVGDFVNGELVREPIDKENGYNSDYTGFQQFLNAYGEIKSILTHEQYEDNCYRLEE